jgi:two-component system LytT family response regulator
MRVALLPKENSQLLPIDKTEEKNHTATRDYWMERRARKIALPSMEGIHLERVEDIVCLKAEGNYTELVFKDHRKLLVCKTLGEVEGMLKNVPQFIRIHRSFAINLDQLKKYVRGKGGHVVMENGQKLSVSAGKKQQFLNTLNAYFG